MDWTLSRLVGLEYGTCVARGWTTEMEEIDASGKMP